MENKGKFIEFMEGNRLLLHSDEIRPVKSITRNIISGVSPFIDYYKTTKAINLSCKDISRKILHLNVDMSSTTRDNIRNLEELKFIAKSGNSHRYRFTINFVDFVNSGLSIREYIIKEINSIKAIDDITMFYNCILSLLYEATVNGYITTFPDSKQKFCKIVPDKKRREEFCTMVSEIYGFKGTSDLSFPNYTPNANYRFISTCVELGLIEKVSQTSDKLGRFQLTRNGSKIIDRLNSNFSWYKYKKIEVDEVNIPEKIIVVETEKLYEDKEDKEYKESVDNVLPELLESFVDIPIPLANSINCSKRKRDPKKGANAKKRANYKCEFNRGHELFATPSNSGYVEAHHLIPVKDQNKFVCDLDVEANIVALCPNCHNLLHYGNFDDKKPILEKLYNERIERLKNCGIFLSLEELFKIYQ